MLSLCVAFTGTIGGSDAAAQAPERVAIPSDEFSAKLRPSQAAGGIRHCRNLFFSERLRAYGTGCSEARGVARRAARHVTSDTESGWRVDARVRDRHGRVWACAGAGFNPLPLACRRDKLWIKLQVWAD